MTMTMEVELALWDVAGWYAARQEWGRIRVFPVPHEKGKDVWLEAYLQCLGTPVWCETPAQAIQKMEKER